MILSAFLVFSVVACANEDLKGTITESGSTTVYPVANKLAETFTARHPNVIIKTAQGGSGVGISDVNTGKVDIGAASRALSATDPALKTTLIGYDGVAIILHPSNTIQDLKKDDIIKLFSGAVTNWQEIGGPDMPIALVTREEGSGTLTSFKELVMGKTPMIANTVVESSNGAVRTYVSTNLGAIGFLSLGYVDTSVNSVSIDGVVPTFENCKAGKYTFVRPLYFLTKTEPTGVIKSFLDYALSKEGQNIVVNEGFIGVK